MLKETLVMLPGMMCDYRLFEPQIAALEKNHEILVLVLDASSSIDDLARRILNEIHSPTFNLLGLSMGGIVAMSMVGLAPQRVRRLALLDTNHKADSTERIKVRNRQISDVRKGGLRDVIANEMKPNYLARCNRSNKTLLNLLIDMAMGQGEEVFINQSISLRDRLDHTAVLRAYPGPTLVLCGEEDRLCPPLLHAEMAEELSHGVLRIIKNCGHISTLEQPEAVTTAIQEWLSQAVPLLPAQQPK